MIRVCLEDTSDCQIYTVSNVYRAGHIENDDRHTKVEGPTTLPSF